MVWLAAGWPWLAWPACSARRPGWPRRLRCLEPLPATPPPESRQNIFLPPSVNQVACSPAAHACLSHSAIIRPGRRRLGAARHQALQASDAFFTVRVLNQLTPRQCLPYFSLPFGHLPEPPPTEASGCHAAARHSWCYAASCLPVATPATDAIFFLHACRRLLFSLGFVTLEAIGTPGRLLSTDAPLNDAAGQRRQMPGGASSRWRLRPPGA